MGRPVIKPAPAPAKEVEPVTFVPSGSLMLDLVLGGQGWALGRMVNLVGDKSTGKTLLAIEMCANLARITDPNNIRYAEAESAFDLQFARSIGCPEGIRLSEPGAINTMEDFQADLEEFLDSLPGNVPAAYVLDSFDSLTSEAELAKDFGEGSYGDGKAKLGSKLFRMMIRKLESKNCLLLIISQIRDKIGVTFGETKTRSGGHALDFYASQIVWLAQVKSLVRTAHNIQRTYGVLIKAKNKKCKVGLPHRDAELTLLFDYGMDDETSMIEWLKEAKEDIIIEGEVFKYEDAHKTIASMRKEGDRAGLQAFNATLRELVLNTWNEIEDRIKQPISKY